MRTIDQDIDSRRERVISLREEREAIVARLETVINKGLERGEFREAQVKKLHKMGWEYEDKASEATFRYLRERPFDETSARIVTDSRYLLKYTPQIAELAAKRLRSATEAEETDYALRILNELVGYDDYLSHVSKAFDRVKKQDELPPNAFTITKEFVLGVPYSAGEAVPILEKMYYSGIGDKAEIINLIGETRCTDGYVLLGRIQKKAPGEEREAISRAIERNKGGLDWEVFFDFFGGDMDV